MKLLPLLLLLGACASGLTIRPGECPGYVKLKLGEERSQEQASFSLTEFGVGQQKVTVDELLQEAKAPACRKLNNLRVSISSDGWDQVISIIPFVSQWSVKLEWDRVQEKSEAK